MSGLSLISSYQPAIAQQNMTGAAGNATNATMTGGGTTTAGGPTAAEGEGSGGGAAGAGGTTPTQ